MTFAISKELQFLAGHGFHVNLLDPAFATNYEQTFFSNIARIAQIPQGQTAETIASFYNAQGKEVDGFEIKTGIAVGMIALVSFLGLLPRLKEYSNRHLRK